MREIKTRKASAEDIAQIKGQLDECTAILVEVMSGSHGALPGLTSLLERRTYILQAALDKAASGESLIFHDGSISFHHEQQMLTAKEPDVAAFSLIHRANELQGR